MALRVGAYPDGPYDRAEAAGLLIVLGWVVAPWLVQGRDVAGAVPVGILGERLALRIGWLAKFLVPPCCLDRGHPARFKVGPGFRECLAESAGVAELRGIVLEPDFTFGGGVDQG